MVHRAQRPGVGVGGHISTYASTASLYEVGFNHFFRGKDHPGGGDQIFFQGHASPGMYARAFLEGRLSTDQLDGFRQELVAPRRAALSSYPHPRLMPDVLGVPDRLDGPRPAERDLPGAVQQVPARTAASRTPPTSTCGRSSATARWTSPRAAARCSIAAPRGARQPHLRRQLQPAAPRRPGARQRQDHPGARSRSSAVPAGTSSRSSGAASGTSCCAADRDGALVNLMNTHARRRLPDLQGRGRRLRPRALLRPRPAHPQAGRGLDRRARSGPAAAAATTTARCTPPTARPPSTRASRRSSWPRPSRAGPSATTSRAATPRTR